MFHRALPALLLALAPPVAAEPPTVVVCRGHEPEWNLRIAGSGATLATLDAHGIEYLCRQQKGSGIWQVFFHDPNGAKVELDFAPEESGPR